VIAVRAARVGVLLRPRTPILHALRRRSPCAPPAWAPRPGRAHRSSRRRLARPLTPAA